MNKLFYMLAITIWSATIQTGVLQSVPSTPTPKNNLLAQQPQPPTPVRPYIAAIYYRPKGSTNPHAWNPVSTYYPLDHDDKKNEYARIIRSPYLYKHAFKSRMLRLLATIRALEKRLQDLKLFILHEFPDTFNKIY